MHGRNGAPDTLGLLLLNAAANRTAYSFVESGHMLNLYRSSIAIPDESSPTWRRGCAAMNHRDTDRVPTVCPLERLIACQFGGRLRAARATGVTASPHTPFAVSSLSACPLCSTSVLRA